MNTLLIVAFLSGGTIGVIITFISIRKPVAQEAVNHGAETKLLARENIELLKKEAYNEGKEVGRKEAFNDFGLIVTPLYKERSIGILGAKKIEYEFGYSYQLTIKGVPCLKPAEIIIEKRQEKHIDADTIKQVVESIVEGAISGATGIPIQKNPLRIVKDKA